MHVHANSVSALAADLRMQVGAEMAQTGDGEWLTVSEAARRLGVTRQTLQYRIKKGKIEHRQDNRGNPIVRFAVEALKSAQASPDAKAAEACADAQHPIPAGLASLDDVRRMLGEQSERLQAAHREAMTALEQRMAQQDANHLAEIERLVGQVHAERSFWTERADAAEVRAEAAEQRTAEMAKQLVEQATRPWWSRWFGASTRSDLRRE